MAGLVRQRLASYLGIVTGKNPKAVQVRVSEMKRNEFLNMYFTEYTDHWAIDPTEKAKDGDVVLIKELENSMSDMIHHQIKEIVYPVGHIIDPISGRRCRGPKFIDDDRRELKPLNIYDEANKSKEAL